ncbi:MAG: FimB/Mfa2 family fimbrial subunit [Petrimonas sp.]|nr:FimB/Mfa2 family fimbrial subunit [Petrimonas sp.]
MKNIWYKMLVLALVGIHLFAVTSCDDTIYDDLQPCDVWVQFNYDYNMQFVNRFGTEATDVQMFVFDENGKFVSVFSDNSGNYSEDFKTSLPLNPGKYTLVTYSGLDGNYAALNLTPGVSTPEDLKVLVNRTAENSLNTELKPLLYGIAQNVEVTGQYGNTVTVPMMKLTNKIRIVFQDLSKDKTSQIDVNNYEFEITGANGSYNGLGASLDDALLHYTPYYTANLEGGGAAVEINTLRLLADKEYRLIIRDKNTGNVLLDTDLISLLLQTKFHENNSMTDRNISTDKIIIVLCLYLTGVR